MQILGLLFVIAICTAIFGPGFLVLIAVVAVLAGIGYLFFSEDEADRVPDTPEERERRRQHREEERHARRMASIERMRVQQQIDAQLEAQKKANRNQVLGTVGKIAVSAGLHALSKGAINHRHHR